MTGYAEILLRFTLFVIIIIILILIVDYVRIVVDVRSVTRSLNYV